MYKDMTLLTSCETLFPITHGPDVATWRQNGSQSYKLPPPAKLTQLHLQNVHTSPLTAVNVKWCHTYYTTK